jgi:hypothetical protein
MMSAASEYPNQARIDSALSYDPSSGKRDFMMKHIVEVSKNFDDTLEKYGIDAIIGPADGPLCSFSAGTGKQPSLPPERSEVFAQDQVPANALPVKKDTPCAPCR